MTIAETDHRFLKRAFELANAARAKGNHPFGALLVGPDGSILAEAENTVVSERDPTGHAETNLVRLAAKQFPSELLEASTLYTSTEPCAMCCGAIFWGNVHRVVYGLSAKRLIEIVGDKTRDVLDLPAAEIFARGRKQIELVGPLLESQAESVHDHFWQVSE